MAKDDDKIIANAIGYERDGNLYIWIMAVHPNFRGQGITKEFLSMFEEESKKKHLPALTIKTHNMNKEMFALLIKKVFRFMISCLPKQTSFTMPCV